MLCCFCPVCLELSDSFQSLHTVPSAVSGLAFAAAKHAEVPVFKHPVKKDLLPFEDRIAMCKLAVSASNIGNLVEHVQVAFVPAIAALELDC